MQGSATTPAGTRRAGCRLWRRRRDDRWFGRDGRLGDCFSVFPSPPLPLFHSPSRFPSLPPLAAPPRVWLCPIGWRGRQRAIRRPTARRSASPAQTRPALARPAAALVCSPGAPPPPPARPRSGSGQVRGGGGNGRPASRPARRRPPGSTKSSRSARPRRSDCCRKLVPAGAPRSVPYPA